MASVHISVKETYDDQAEQRYSYSGNIRLREVIKIGPFPWKLEKILRFEAVSDEEGTLDYKIFSGRTEIRKGTPWLKKLVEGAKASVQHYLNSRYITEATSPVAADFISNTHVHYKPERSHDLPLIEMIAVMFYRDAEKL